MTQAYCSALPVGYSRHDATAWEPFARLVLEASYEATIYAAAANAQRTGNATTFLTLVGGGVFGNRLEWILDALERACDLAAPASDLDIVIVSYGHSNPSLAPLIANR